MRPQEATTPADRPTLNSLHYTHSVPSVSQHSWQRPRSGEDTGSAWTPEFQEPFHQLPAGATDIAMETIATAASSKGSKIGAVIQDSSYGAAQPQDRRHHEAPSLGKAPMERPVTQWLQAQAGWGKHSTPNAQATAECDRCLPHLRFTQERVAELQPAQREKSPQEIIQEWRSQALP